LDWPGNSTLVSFPYQAFVQPAELDIPSRMEHSLSAHGHRCVAGLQRSGLFDTHDWTGLFVLQLALNLAWSWIFFRKHAIGSAAVEVALLWCSIGATTVLFSQVSSTAAWLIAPYWAWVTFASILNASIWRLNPTAG
jgi:TspO/MBR family